MTKVLGHLTITSTVTSHSKYIDMS